MVKGHLQFLKFLKNRIEYCLLWLTCQQNGYCLLWLTQVVALELYIDFVWGCTYGIPGMALFVLPW